VELALLEILEHHQGDEMSGRELRRLLTRRGFRRSAPAFVFTMMSLEDKGLVTCREEVSYFHGMEVAERYYSQNES
jgi:hypothetical protein